MGWERLLWSSDVSGEVEGPKTVKSDFRGGVITNGRKEKDNKKEVACNGHSKRIKKVSSEGCA